MAQEKRPWASQAPTARSDFMSTSDGRTATRQQPNSTVIAEPEREGDEDFSAHIRPPHNIE